MRRVLLVLAAISTLSLSATYAFAGGGYHGHHHNYCGPRVYAPRAVVYRPAPIYAAPVVAAPVAAPYYTAYPSPYPSFGIGLANRNFSLWFQQ